MKSLVAVGIVCLAGTFALEWVDTPIEGGHCRQGNNCAKCHENSAPRTHTADFVEVGHGSVAQLNRQQCIGCHQRAACDECHLKTPPRWHTEAFRHPADGRTQRDEHAMIATGHHATCAECHAQRFQDQCASCHRPNEEDLELRFPE